jgi:acyl-coenzyme A thioesterase PaaI-like protein
VSVLANSMEPFSDRSGVRVVDASSGRVVVQQEAANYLDNHVGVRHASALHAAAYEAARLLVANAVDPLALAASVRLQVGDIEYVTVGIGVLTTVAEPSGDDWSSLGAGLTATADVTLDCVAVTSDAQGKTVARLRSSWIMTPQPTS